MRNQLYSRIMSLEFSINVVVANLIGRILQALVVGYAPFRKISDCIYADAQTN